jgi:hypothetical protein
MSITMKMSNPSQSGRSVAPIAKDHHHGLNFRQEIRTYKRGVSSCETMQPHTEFLFQSTKWLKMVNHRNVKCNQVSLTFKNQFLQHISVYLTVNRFFNIGLLLVSSISKQSWLFAFSVHTAGICWLYPPLSHPIGCYHITRFATPLCFPVSML